MRKLILTVAVAVLTGGVSISAFANDNINNNSNSIVTVVMNDGFKEITVKELPEAVVTAILKDFKTATVTKVYVNGSEQYKIELTVDEAESVVYADKEGKWLKEEEVSVEE
ncbi:hypothetical protein [Polaribacter butkevichii]|uniref:Beta-lactamase-inhibitor-like PepSY-like domain-containing protein n=1 Tax=Polaribacter butkevichii TaxID=218490 RepID=A0A2P6CA33_9FLAO|nr:hypothetical protein [Polaribacter butkevichii]PQJ71776.1 hypothetical protein BTO14_00250 [Polaribacter butkevichii]